MTKKEKYIHTIFSSIAKRYDFLNSLLSLRLDKRWREFTVSVSGLKPGQKILDVCTGTGELALAYAKALGNNTRVINTDFCHDMLIICKEKLAKNKMGKMLVTIEADTLNLPFKNNSFDVVSVGFGIRNLTDIRRGIREMARVVVPGGRVVIFEFTQPINSIFRGIYYLYFTKVLPLIGNVISQNRNDAYGYLPNSVVVFPDRNQLKEIMEECGLRNVKVYAKTFGIVAIHVASKPNE